MTAAAGREGVSEDERGGGDGAEGAEVGFRERL